MPHHRRRFISTGFVSLAIFLVSVSILKTEEKPLASSALIQALCQEVSGEIAYQYTVLISQFDRIQASRGWHAAAEMIKKELEEIGYSDALIEGWPSNGSRYYYTYQTPIGWDASQAELWMLSPRKEKLCSLEEIPLTLVKHSHSADVEAELVDVGTGVGAAAYAGKEVRDRIVLATAYTSQVMREAVGKRGALGVITWFAPDERPGFPEMIRYTALWPRWEEREQMGFGFNVSKQQGWLLKKMLDAGEKVVLSAQVKTEYYDSRIEVLSASLPGTEEPETEVLILGHLCHPMPSANDNASGSGGMLEMARALKKMIASGLIPAPRRTIRFLWVPEFYGTVPYIQAHLERTRNTLSAINCDMIGEDLHKTGGLFTITCTPDSLPSYLNDVVCNFARTIQAQGLESLNGSRHAFAFQVHPYGGGSDHVVFNDGALKVPSVMFGHGDTFHHTSLDTPDKVDASELRRVCAIALGASTYLAAAGDAEALAMARLITRNALGRLSAEAYDALHGVCVSESPDSLHEAYSQSRNILEQAAARESAAVLSTFKFTSDKEIRKEIRGMLNQIQSLQSILDQNMFQKYAALCRAMKTEPEVRKLSAKEAKLSVRIPVRADYFICPLQENYIGDKLGEQALGQLKLPGISAYEALNFVDGNRSVGEISRAVSAECGPVSVQDVYEFFQLLEKSDLLKWKKE